MDPERSRIQADLAGQLAGDVRCDDTYRQIYASDASIYESIPLGVVRPANVNDVITCVQYAEENQLSIIPRGGGSNVCGGAVGNGLVVDFSYSMRRVMAVEKDSVTVEPGVILADLNRQLERHGRFFAPDPATRNVTTIGGTLSMNNSGSHWIADGTPHDSLVSLKVVLANGEVAQFDNPDHSGDTNPGLRAQLIAGRMENILARNASLIEQYRPHTKVNQAGYNLFDFKPGKQMDLTKLIVGAEGTLGMIVEATLKTNPIPRHRGVSLLFFHRLDTAAKTAVEITKMGVAACDLVDRRLLSLARETNSELQRLIPSTAEAMLLVEFRGTDDRQVREKLDHIDYRIQRRKKWAFDVVSTTQQQQRDLYWRIVRRIVPTLYRLKGDQRALPFVEDIAIAPEKLPEFLQGAHRILNENEVTASIFSHAPQGTVHIRPFLNLSNPVDVNRMQRLATQLFDYVLELKGTVSGSHGDGLSRTWYLRRQYGKLYNAFSEVKSAFDAYGVFNPGKIVGHPYYGLGDNIRSVLASRKFLGLEDELTDGQEGRGLPAEGTANFNGIDPSREPAEVSQKKNKQKKPSPSSALPIFEPELNWQLPQIALAARNCNGCGRCRTASPNERMCPLFRLSPREEASPRSKANLMRGVVTGQLDPQSLATEEAKELADLCVNCHQCRIECPAGVDIPKLMMEAKAQYYLNNGSRLSDWMLTRLDWLYEIAGYVPNIVNRLLQSQLARWMLDKSVGIAQGRKLPLFAQTTFMRWAAREKLNRPSKQQARKIVFFVDAYANWNDVEVGKALVKVLAHNGINVVVPPSQNVSGMSLISDGAVARAKKLATKNVEMLAEWVRQGYRVVTTEPSAALAISHEYLNLLDEPDAELVAKNTIDSMSFLIELHEQGELALDFKPVNASIGYHLPCHQRALGSGIPALKLMELIPGLHVELIEKGCSGMAGTYGIKRKNYNRSLRMGFALINAMRSTDIIAGTTECSTCKIQMEQGTTKPTMHPIKVLALAYGLMPELDDMFNRRSGDLVVS